MRESGRRLPEHVRPAFGRASDVALLHRRGAARGSRARLRGVRCTDVSQVASGVMTPFFSAPGFNEKDLACSPLDGCHAT